jgi:predicted Zn-dependent protease
MLKPHIRVNADPATKLRMAKQKLDMGLADEALCLTGEVLDNDSEHLGALEVHVCAQWRAGDFIGALRSLRRLSLLNPYEPGYFLMEGDTLNLIGRPLEARRAYERCLTFTGTAAREDASSHIAIIDAQLGINAHGEMGWDSADNIMCAGDNGALSIQSGLSARPS